MSSLKQTKYFPQKFLANTQACVQYRYNWSIEEDSILLRHS